MVDEADEMNDSGVVDPPHFTTRPTLSIGVHGLTE